jgi:hypothetical protein
MLQANVHSSYVPDKTVSRDRPLEIPRQPVNQARDPCRATLGNHRYKNLRFPRPLLSPVQCFYRQLLRVSLQCCSVFEEVVRGLSCAPVVLDLHLFLVT